MSLITLLLNRSHSASVIFPLLWFPSKAALPSRIPPISLEGQGPQRGCHTVNIFSKNQFRFIKSIHIYRYLNIGNGMLYIYGASKSKNCQNCSSFSKKTFSAFFSIYRDILSNVHHSGPFQVLRRNSSTKSLRVSFRLVDRHWYFSSK